MLRIEKMEPGDVLLLPTYYYSQPYKALESQIEFKAEAALSSMVEYMKKVLGERVQNQIMTLVPPTQKMISKAVAEQVVILSGQTYIHAELYLGKGWVLAGWFEGVKLIKYKPSAFQVFDVVRYKGLDKDKMLKAVDKYWNLPYDYQSLGINSIIEIVNALGNFVGYEDLEEKIEDWLPWDNPRAMICSELVARMLMEGGIQFKKPEFISPQDLLEHPDQKLI